MILPNVAFGKANYLNFVVTDVVNVHAKDEDRIVRGKDADKNSIPWQALLTSLGGRKCGGVILSEQYVNEIRHFVNETSLHKKVKLHLKTDFVLLQAFEKKMLFI